MKQLIYIITAFVLMFASTAMAQDQTITIQSGNYQRSFDVHLPAGQSGSGLPVILCYHGSGGTSADIRSTTGFDPLSDQNGFVVVYPQAVSIGGDIQWNAYVDNVPGDAALSDPNAPDDIQFTRDIVSYLSTHFGVDTKRVYATGLSNGGFMCYALSMLASTDIAAIAPVAGNLWAEDGYITTLLESGTVQPMPVMHVHGTADQEVDYPDPDNKPEDYQEYPLYIAARGCDALTYSQVVPIMTNVDKLVFCPPPIEVSLIRITGMQHAWTNGVYPTSSAIVAFFGLQKSSGVATTNRPTEDGAQFDRTTNCIRGRLLHPATAKLYNTLGKCVMSAELPSGEFSLRAESLLPQSYFLSIDHGEISGRTTQKILISR